MSNPKATSTLESFLKSNKREVLDGIQQAKTKRRLDDAEETFLRNLLGNPTDLQDFLDGKASPSFSGPRNDTGGKENRDNIPPNAGNDNGIGTGNSETEQPNQISTVEFLEHAISLAAKTADTSQWQDFKIFVVFKDQGEKYFSATTKKKADMIAAIKGLEGLSENADILHIQIVWNGNLNKFKPPFCKTALDTLFRNIQGDLEALKTLLTGIGNLTPLKNLDGKEYLKSDLNLVDVNPSHQDASDFFANHEAIQGDKSYAVVVAGESGSGKSVFSCQQALDAGYLPIYCQIPCASIEIESIKSALASDNEGKANDAEKERTAQPNLVQELLKKPKACDLPTQMLIEFLRALIVATEACQKKGCPDSRTLYHIKNKFNTSRNMWAERVLDAAIESVLERNDNARLWFQGCWHESAKPEKVAIIVDEATDIDLAEGLVSTVRETSSKYKEILAKKDVILVLTGTGLDLIKYEGRVGTNPDYSRLIVTIGPNLQTLSEKAIEPEVLAAMSKGIFSQVFQTNSRMLFRAALPVLRQSFHKVDGFNDPTQDHRKIKKARYEKRLEAVASTACIMDYAVRYYVNQNSVGLLSAATRCAFLSQAFVYHLSEAMNGVKSILASVSAEVRNNHFTEVNRIEKGVQAYKATENQADNIFSRGLVNRIRTSNALKYLACFGLTCELRPQFGDEFEELTALHFMRYMSVQGYESQRRTLKHAWQPKRSKNSMDSESVEKRKQAESFELMDKVEKYCLVFVQGTPSAQGGDIMALIVTPEGAKLISIQCKHYTKSPGAAEVRKWWDSLGIDFSEENANWNPDEETSAGYSLKGLLAFRDVLKHKLGRGVELGDRIMACSFATPTGKTDFPIPREKEARVWFREMFEPTISVLELKPGWVPGEQPEDD